MFGIRWSRRARDELADAWLRDDSAVRAVITPASSAIDQQLRVGPGQQGESRSLGRRILFIAPLTVVFRVESTVQRVSVLHIRLHRRKRPR